MSGARPLSAFGRSRTLFAAVAAILAVLLFFLCPVLAAPLQVFVRNRPVQGPFLQVGGEVYALPEAVRPAFGKDLASLAWDTATSQVTVNGKILPEPLQQSEGKVFLPLKAMAVALGYEVRYNPATGILDISRPASTRAATAAESQPLPGPSASSSPGSEPAPSSSQPTLKGPGLEELRHYLDEMPERDLQDLLTFRRVFEDAYFVGIGLLRSGASSIQEVDQAASRLKESGRLFERCPLFVRYFPNTARDFQEYLRQTENTLPLAVQTQSPGIRMTLSQALSKLRKASEGVALIFEGCWKQIKESKNPLNLDIKKQVFNTWPWCNWDPVYGR